MESLSQDFNLDQTHPNMVVVRKLMEVKTSDNCKSPSDAYVALIIPMSLNYEITRVVFDNYSIRDPIKEATREWRRDGKVGY